METEQEKRRVRDEVWGRLDRLGAVPPPGPYGRIPNFVGAEAAARRLADLPEWHRARVVKSNPDKAQFAVRMRALAEAKLVYMAVPKLADAQPFYLLDPAIVGDDSARVATSAGAAANAPKVGVDQMRPVDLVICGSVAVNRDGVRVGKGAGYSDIEVALLMEAGLIGPETILATTVHAAQVLDRPLPESPHDFRVDLIVTPDEVIRCGSSRRPGGIYWDALDAGKIDAIPVLALNPGRPIFLTPVDQRRSE
ncbi:5-formyltetrahydrofolate cyclo-ligase [Plantactinospora sp. B24E8]|uniref:5-formyltetrahydrofolate cyclo-ligase n=1 Tax=Plantactinospora sp. B24E8 TaxID=3153567 RepID=UPI00325D40C2